jgi:hypothetical protein
MRSGCRFLACLSCLTCCTAHAYADSQAEYRLKAAFLSNFVSFTEWPDSVGSPINVCVYGPDPFGEELDKLRGKAIGTRSLQVRRVASVDGLDGCQVVFVARPVIGNLARVFDRVNGKLVLIVADSPGAAHQGAALNMTTGDGKVTFEANLAAARGSGLNLSSKMLRLASEVIK